jgi:3',5'-cyclic AMP phosphodiesterase CpdA
MVLKNRYTTALLLLLLAGGLAVGDSRPLTFVVWSDSHFGAYDFADTTRLDIMAQINALPAAAPPEGFVPLPDGTPPDFLMHCGDITEKGTAAQWNDPNALAQQSYIQTLTHLDRRIQPYAILGNHDSRKAQNIRQPFAALHRGTYYAFDCKGVHVVALDPYPTGNSAAPALDAAQLDWLRADLAALAPQTPILIMMHILPIFDEGLDRTSRLDRQSSDALAGLLNGKNVLAFFHGHWHARSVKDWHGIPVIAPAGFAYWRSGCKNGHPVLGVVQLTDTALAIYTYNWHTGAYEPAPYYQKPLVTN